VQHGAPKRALVTHSARRIPRDLPKNAIAGVRKAKDMPAWPSMRRMQSNYEIEVGIRGKHPLLEYAGVRDRLGSRRNSCGIVEGA
jgi:hypothetical protein